MAAAPSADGMPLLTPEPPRGAAGEDPVADKTPRRTDSGTETQHPVFQKAIEILKQSHPLPGRPGDLVPQQIPPAAASTNPDRRRAVPDVLPARMLNEFVYCPRLFYYEFVDGIFVESADTIRGKALHKRVDAGTGQLPPPRRPVRTKPDTGTLELPLADNAAAPPPAAPDQPPSDEAEIIHSRSVQMGSERLGVVAKMDLVELRPVPDEAGCGMAGAMEVCPVDYKVGAPREGELGGEIWDADRMQLGVQALILRDNGYSCHEGVIYYRATRQRIRLPISRELVAWVEEQIVAARMAAAGPVPPPLAGSGKCARCSLAPVCLPDETRLLSEPSRASSPVRRLMAGRDERRAVYLSTPGLRVGRKEELLQIKQEGSLIDEVRIQDVSHLALFGHVQLSTQALHTLCEAEVPITYFSLGGWFYGVTRGHALKNVFLRLEQFRLAGDEAMRLRLARQFVHGKIRNHRTLLMRNHVEPPPEVLVKLKQCAESAVVADSLPTLLGIEGAAAAAYFQELGGMIKAGRDRDGERIGAESASDAGFRFDFHGRHRRPPTDPVNALLSLAYSLLAKDCLLASLAVGFDPYVGFYHQPRFGRPALALDLMEEFRPLIAESAVLSSINNRVVGEGDFVRAGPAVNLTPAGRKKFFQVYEQRMQSLLTHPVFDYKVSYRRALELQARLLAKALTGEVAEYVPLTTR